MSSTSHIRPAWQLMRVFALLALLVAALAGYAPHAQAAPPTDTALEFDTPGTSGFTTYLSGTTPPDGTNQQVSGGALRITTTSGDLPPNGGTAPSPTAQDNALAITYQSQGAYTIGARLLNPSVFQKPGQSAGIFIGQDSSNYIRFTLGVGSKRSSAPRLQLDVMDRGKLRSATIDLSPATLTAPTIDLFLNVDHTGGGKLTALYRIDSADPNAGRLATSRNFPRWLRQIGPGSVYAGVISTSRSAPSIEVDFDWFRLTLAPQVTPSLSATKTVNRDGITGPAVNPEDTLTYTISVTNNSNASVTVQVADPIPVDTTYVQGSATNGAAPDGSNSQVLWSTTIGSLQSASFTFQVKINPAPLQSSTILNTAALTSSAGGFPALLSASTLVNGVPDLSGSDYSAAPASVGKNGQITYTLNLLNDGPGIANNATAQLILPTKTTYVQGSAHASSGSLLLDPSHTLLTWSAAGPLAVNGTAAISFTVQASGSFINNEPIISQAIVQADGELPSIATAQALFVDALSVAGVSGTKTVDKAEADPGATLSYTITVVNNASTPANSLLSLVDPIPQDTAFVSSSIPTVGSASYDSANKRVNWEIGTLGAGQSATLSLQVTINQLPLHSALVVNKAVLTNPAVSVPQTLLSAATVVRGVADLSNSSYNASPVNVGTNGVVTYALNLLSNGTAAASAATAQLTIPNVPGVTFVANSATASSGNIVPAGSQLNWSAGGPLPIGALVKISFQMKVTGTPTNGVAIPSTATVQASGTLPTVLATKATYGTIGQAPNNPVYVPIIVR